MTSLTNKILRIDKALGLAGIDHAFGGALALAWCTERARGTIDIDVNVFVEVTRSADVVDSLSPPVTCTEADLALLERDGQARLWWDNTPIDVFLNTTEFHAQVGERVRFEQFAGMTIPFLSCSDLAVFKAFFNRTKDWADLEEMVAIGSLDVDRTLGVLVRHLGFADERVARLRSIASA